jgi:predicted transcriptional regulator
MAVPPRVVTSLNCPVSVVALDGWQADVADEPADGRILSYRPAAFSSYDFLMVADEQISREHVTDEQIQQWADEAEAGYDVEELKRRGRGRPGRGAEPMQVIAVRLTAEEIAALDAYAAREHLSRSEAIRRALADYAA